jgi:hypothetical protein
LLDRSIKNHPEPRVHRLNSGAEQDRRTAALLPKSAYTPIAFVLVGLFSLKIAPSLNERSSSILIRL